jgi:nitroreductase
MKAMGYQEFLKLLKYRRSIRRFKKDPIPDEYVTMILEASRYAMSGGNSQPWEFIVVKDPQVKNQLFKAYHEEFEQTWYLEQMRVPKYRHPAFNVSPEERDQTMSMTVNWGDAPVIIAVLADPRKQFGSVLGAFRPPSVEVLAATMGHLSMTIHLAAASLRLGSQRVDISIQQPYRDILGYPEPLILNILVPVGYRAYEPGPPLRLPLKESLHLDRYDMSKYLAGKDFLKYIERIRSLGTPGYRAALKGNSRD